MVVKKLKENTINNTGWGFIRLQDCKTIFPARFLSGFKPFLFIERRMPLTIIGRKIDYKRPELNIYCIDIYVDCPLTSPIWLK
jgi:hypothetical protein